MALLSYCKGAYCACQGQDRQTAAAAKVGTQVAVGSGNEVLQGNQHAAPKHQGLHAAKEPQAPPPLHAPQRPKRLYSSMPFRRPRRPDPSTPLRRPRPNPSIRPSSLRHLRKAWQQIKGHSVAAAAQSSLLVSVALPRR